MHNIRNLRGENHQDFLKKNRLNLGQSHCCWTGLIRAIMFQGRLSEGSSSLRDSRASPEEIAITHAARRQCQSSVCWQLRRAGVRAWVFWRYKGDVAAVFNGKNQVNEKLNEPKIRRLLWGSRPGGEAAMARHPLFKLSLFRNQSRFSEVQEQMWTPADEGEEMLHEVNPTPDELLPLIGIFGHVRTSNLLFSSQMTTSGIPGFDDPACCWRTDHVLLMDAEEPSSQLRPTLATVNLTGVDIWKPAPHPTSVPTPACPRPLAPSAVVCETQFYLRTHLNFSLPPNPFRNRVEQLFLGIKIHLEQMTWALY